MFTRRALIVLLAGINVILLVGLLAANIAPSAAFAQAGSPGGMACVTAKAAGRTYDVVYLLDSAQHKLHAFYASNPQTKKHVHAGFRDLAQDLGKK